MNAIIGFAEMLSEPGLSLEERRQFSSIVQSRSEDLMHIINDLLEISRIESGNTTAVKAPVILNELIDDLGTIYTRKLLKNGKSNISLSLSKPLHTASSTIFTDGYIIRQLFSNLLDNAIKFTRTGTIAFGYHAPEGGSVTCFVADTGIGISVKNREVIFEHFRQGDLDNSHQYGGTGLGLAICKGAVALLGGDIRVESDLGKGSTFFFTIPWEEAAYEVTLPLDPLPKKSSGSIYSFSQKRILLVEDEASNMEFLSVILKATGAELVPVYTAKELREHYSTLDSVDLVLLDVRLPDASGWDLAIELKTRRPALPVIAQTAFAMSSDQQKSVDAGCDGFISKPISREGLLKLIATHL
jgi:CheY-like chemotaxis protein/two-component sensor histidine kinase